MPQVHRRSTGSSPDFRLAVRPRLSPAVRGRLPALGLVELGAQWLGCGARKEGDAKLGRNRGGSKREREGAGRGGGSVSCPGKGREKKK